MSDFPSVRQTVLDTPDPRRLSEFYRELLGLRYRMGDEIPENGTDEPDWLVLVDGDAAVLAFQFAADQRPTTWPRPGVPMQMHLDFTVSDAAALERQRQRALTLGARELIDDSDDAEEPLYVFADPAGHPFCIFVG